MLFGIKKNIPKVILVAPTHYYYYKGLSIVFYLLSFFCFMFSFIMFLKLVNFL